MPKKEFRIIASTGKNYYEFFFIIQMPRGDLYFGDVLRKRRFSYHASGVQHEHTQNGIFKYGHNEMLKDFKGIKQLIGMTFGKTVLESPMSTKTPSLKNATRLVYFDIRHFKNIICVDIFLLEPENYMSLLKVRTTITNSQFTILTETKPWIVVIFHEPNN